jgi:hypothetical protein
VDRTVANLEAGLASLNGPELARDSNSLCLAYQRRFEHTDDLRDLDAAIRFGGDAVAASVPDREDRATYRQNLGRAFGARYDVSSDGADLDANVSHAEEALRLTPPRAADRPPRLSNVGLARLRRFRRLGEPRDLALAVDSLEDAVRVAPEGDAEYPTYLANLAIAYSERFDQTGDVSDLDLARANEERALELTPPGHADHPSRLANLAATHLQRYWLLGDPADLDACLANGKEAVRHSRPGTLQHRSRLRNLGYAYQARYELTGVVSEIDAAIRCGLDALEACPPDAPDRAFHLSAVGFAHLIRSVPLAGDGGDDLDAGVGYMRAALAATPDEDPGRALRTADVGTAYRQRFTRRGDAADLDEAIRLGADALRDLPEEHPRRAVLLSTQSDSHYERFVLTAARRGADAATDPDAVAMVDLAVEAIRLSPPGNAQRPRYLADLGEIYRTLAEVTGDAGTADRAVEFLSAALADMPPDHPSRTPRLTQLARSHLACTAPDRPRALALLREAVAVTTARPTRRLDAARLWGDIGAEHDDADAAAEGYAAAVDLLPLLAWRGLGRPERQARLAATAGLTSLATAWAITAGHRERAVEVLEQGRAVLWAQTLQTRTDLTALRATRPDLADRLAALRDRIDGGAARSAADHRRDAEDWESTVDEVRNLDGFSAFLRPVPYADLRAAAAGGPVVLVNVSAARCDALIVTAGDDVRLVPLPDLDERECVRRAAELSAAVGAGPARAGRDLGRSTNPKLFELLGWLWDTVCAPVLAAMDARPGRTRLWWLPTGPLTALPLHAAGRYGVADDNLPGLAVSSYTPTLDALVRSRSDAGTGAGAGAGTGVSEVLAVGMPTTPSTDGLALIDLPGVAVELDRLAARLPCRQLRTATREEPASPTRPPTVDRILAALPSHAWVHFACHGGQDPADPSNGALYLADGPLSVLRIAALDLPAAELAFLSACGTAVGGPDLHDEAIHLAAAMQVAGYRHVLATAWSISDEHTPDVVDLTYRGMALDAGRSAEAMHDAVAELRAELPDRPDLWAAYLHLGA